MAVALKQFNPTDLDVQQLQQNTADAIAALSDEKQPAVGVVSVSSNTKLVGNEDVVLVDASTAGGEISLVLPGPRLLRRALTVKVTRAGGNAVRIKAVDISGPSAPTIDGAAFVAIPAGSASGVVIVSDGRNYWTL